MHRLLIGSAIGLALTFGAFTITPASAGHKGGHHHHHGWHHHHHHHHHQIVCGGMVIIIATGGSRLLRNGALASAGALFCLLEP